jgi:hypothetical protein
MQQQDIGYKSEESENNFSVYIQLKEEGIGIVINIIIIQASQGR